MERCGSWRMKTGVISIELVPSSEGHNARELHIYLDADGLSFLQSQLHTEV